jgi:pimeloyl-ACP methyl ester carboxylesterase
VGPGEPGEAPSADFWAVPQPVLPLTVDPVLDAAIARDLSRGRRVAALTWLVAALHGVLGLVAFQQGALLVNVDRTLATTPEIEAFGASFLVVRIALVVAIGGGLWLAFRWLRAALGTAEILAGSGAIEGAPGPIEGSPGPIEGSPGAVGGKSGAAQPPTRRSLHRLGVLFRPAGVPLERVSWSDVRIGSGRRLTVLALIVVSLAAVGGVAAAIASAAAGDLAAARLAHWVAGLDAGLWIIGTLLLGAVAADIAWRIAVAGRAVGHFAPLADAPSRPFIRLTPAVLVFVGLIPIAATASVAQDVPCRATSLECAKVIVPVDHGGSANQPVISVVYGIHRASGPSHGTLVVAVGGPGGSGLASADAQIDSFDPRLVDAYDIVFWDQRGVGRSDGHDCPIAGGIYSTVEPNDTSAKAFVDACLREADTGSAGLGRYSTRQAAEDLESIRDRIGVDRFVLYGESYGTELAQVYAAAHPDRLSALILDGSVDLTLTANQFWAAAAQSFDGTLSATFDDCTRDVECRADVADPGGVYDRLVERLRREPEVVRYRDVTGQPGDHRLEAATLQAAVNALLYEPAGRELILRAIAASDSGDDVPIARLADLFGPGISVGVSSFAYHAILCADYRVSPTSDTADFAAVVQAGTSSGALGSRTGDVYFAQLPCLYWPDQPTSAVRPPALTDQPEPIFVLGATLDPITPIAMGRAIAARARDGYLIESSGGPHVTFGRGNPCVDEPIVDFLVDGQVPPTRTSTCTDVVASPYIPLRPLNASAYTDALDAMRSVEDELFADPIYALWGGRGDLTIGCRFGGSVAIRSMGQRDELTFDGCEFARGMPLDGTGGHDIDENRLQLDVTFPFGTLKYTSNTTRHVTGTFRSMPVDERG